MSWTSEFEPSSPRSDLDSNGLDSDGQDSPQLDSDGLDSDGLDSDQLDGDVLDELVENGFSLIDRAADDGPSNNGHGEKPDIAATTNGTGDGDCNESHGIWTDVSEPIDIPDEGPLDPSIFDGLFADLTSDADAEPETSSHDVRHGDHDLDVAADHPDGDPNPPDPGDSDSGDLDLHADSNRDDTDSGGLDLEQDLDSGESEQDLVLDLDEDQDPVGGPDHGGEAEDEDPRGIHFGSQLAGSDEELPVGPDGSDLDHGSPVDRHGDRSTEAVPDSDDLEMAKSLFDTGDVTAQADRAHSTGNAELLDNDQSAGDDQGHRNDQSHDDDQGHRNDQSHNDPGHDHDQGHRQPIADNDIAPPVFDEQSARLHRAEVPKRRWPAFAVATAIGAALGIGGAVALSQFISRVETANGTETVQQPAGASLETTAVDAGEPAADRTTPPSIADIMATGELELNTIRFVPGTLDLTDASLMTLSEVAAEASELGPAPLSVVVRSYSELTAAENLALSVAQAAVIVDYLTGLGLPAELVTATGLGAPLLTPSQPVTNFVAINAGLRPSALRITAQGLNPFAIGLDPRTGDLRPESIEPLNVLGRAMAADQDASVSLAAYSHTKADPAGNQALATEAAEAVAAHLIDGFGIDPGRLPSLTPGQAPYVVATATGNHITLRWGAAADEQAAVAAIEPGAITFAPGSARIADDAEPALGRLIEVFAPSERTLVIEVHTATETTAAANLELSGRQAEAIEDHLTAGGIPASRIRVFGGGDLRQFQDGDQDSLVVVTVVS